MIDPVEVEGYTGGDLLDTIAMWAVIVTLVVGVVTIAAHQLGITHWFISLFA